MDGKSDNNSLTESLLALRAVLDIPMTAEEAKEGGWITAVEYADSAGLTHSQARSRMSRAHRQGKLEKTAVMINGNRGTAYRAKP